MMRPTILMLAAICAVPMCAETISIFAGANSQLDQAAADVVWSDWGASGGSLVIVNYLPDQERNNIFKFSLGALPSGATVTGAKLWLFDTGWDDANYYSLFWHPDSSWDEGSVTWNNFAMNGNVLVGSRTGSIGWQYNAWDIDVGAVDLTQGAATFQLREGFGNYSHNQNNFYTRLSPMLDGQEVRPYLELQYSGDPGGPTTVPEPSSIVLLGAALAGVAGLRAWRVRS